MKYPKGARGWCKLNDFAVISSASRRGCTVSVDPPTFQLAAHLGGFGYKSPVVKSDLYAPTNYAVWFTKPTFKSLVVQGPIEICEYYNSENKLVTEGNSRARASTLAPGSFIIPPVIAQLMAYNSSNSFSSSVALPRYDGRPAWLSAHILELENMILLDVNNQTHQLGITLAESRKTVNYLLRSGISAVQGLINLKRRSSKSFLRWLKTNRSLVLAGYPVTQRRHYARKIRAHLRRKPWDAKLGGRWLEYNYAIMPLVFDVQGAIDLAKDSTWRPFLFSLKKRKEFVVDNNVVKLLVQHNFQIRDPLQFALNRVGLNLPQFVVGTAWELVPFSFVADWFLGLNDLFKGLTALQGVQHNHGFFSVLIEDGKYTRIQSSSSAFTGRALIYNGDSVDVAAPSSVVKFGPAWPLGSVRVENHIFSCFKRQKLGKPTYTWSTSLNLSDRRVATLLSLIAVLRKTS